MVDYLKIENWFYFILFISILVLTIYLIWIIRKRKYTIFDKFSIFKYVGIFCIILIVLIILYFGIIDFYIVIGVSYSSGMLWSFLVALVLGMLMLVIGLVSTKTSKQFNYIILIVVIILSISGLGYLGIRFDVNLPLFLWKTFQSNGIYGIWFYSLNSHIWIFIIFISTVFEKEKE